VLLEMPKNPFRMNSPEPGSSPSTPSSGSPPPNEDQQSHSTAPVFQLASQLSSTLSNNASKRRLPGGSSLSYNTRDLKSRRREEGSSRRMAPGGGGGGWVEGKESGKRDKDDLVDIPLAEHLRKGTRSSVFF
jgi:hypothetical protein